MPIYSVLVAVRRHAPNSFIDVVDEECFQARLALQEGGAFVAFAGQVGFLSLLTSVAAYWILFWSPCIGDFFSALFIPVFSLAGLLFF